MKTAAALLFCLFILNIVPAQQQGIDLYRLALDLYNRNQLQDASSAIEKFLQEKPACDSAFCLAGMIAYKSGNPKKAIRELTKAIKLNKNYFDAWYTRGLAKGELGNFTGAVQDFTKAIQLNPSHFKSWYNRAQAKGYIEEFDAAIKDLDKATTLDSSSAVAFYSRGFWKEASGDYSGAISDYKKALSLDPAYTDASLAIVIARYRNGEKTEACKELNSDALENNNKAVELRELFCK